MDLNKEEIGLIINSFRNQKIETTLGQLRDGMNLTDSMTSLMDKLEAEFKELDKSEPTPIEEPIENAEIVPDTENNTTPEKA